MCLFCIDGINFMLFLPLCLLSIGHHFLTKTLKKGELDKSFKNLEKQGNVKRVTHGYRGHVI